MVESHIGLGNLPGAVVLIGHQDTIVFEKAFGNRSVEPELEAMTPDTVFDLASLTKVVATAPSVMLLVQKGLLNLDDACEQVSSCFRPIWEEESNRAAVVSPLLGPSRHSPANQTAPHHLKERSIPYLSNATRRSTRATIHLQ